MDKVGAVVKMRESYRGGLEPIVHKTQHMGIVAIIAAEFATKWGMVAAMPDGEDSAGRAKVRLATSAEVATRACETAELLHAELQARGLLLALPEPVEEKKDQGELPAGTGVKPV